MLDDEAITRRASEILTGKGLKPDLSEQARAVTKAIVEAINSNLSEPLILVRQPIEGHAANGRMKRPTIDEVLEYAGKWELPEYQARKFFAFYESNGWKVGRNPMKIWTSALANWKRTWQERNGDNSKVSANVAAIRDQAALTRVEDRIKVIRGQLPLAANDPKRAELDGLKGEVIRLKSALGFKA